MSLDIDALTVIGYLLDNDQVETRQVELVKGCDDDTTGDLKFCSQCGQPLWIEKEQEKKLLDKYSSYKNFKVFTYSSDGEEQYAVGIATKKAHINAPVQSIALSEIPKDLFFYAKEVKKELKSLGIDVDVEDFGFHTLLIY
jgi:hypothetical protein